MTTLSKWRINYPDNPIRHEDVLDKSPLQLFSEWLKKAVDDGVVEPNAMSIATAHNNIPDNRVVLLKQVDEQGLIFYTNYESDKAKQLDKNANIAATFWWPQSHRQVRIKGLASKVEQQQSEEYFASRDRDTQIGAWASKQSKVIPSYQSLRDQFLNYKKQLSKEKNIPCPPYWGGYIIQPLEIEFWQGCTSRLHDRILFNRKNLNESNWQISRLSP